MMDKLQLVLDECLNTKVSQGNVATHLRCVGISQQMQDKSLGFMSINGKTLMIHLQQRNNLT